MLPALTSQGYGRLGSWLARSKVGILDDNSLGDDNSLRDDNSLGDENSLGDVIYSEMIIHSGLFDRSATSLVLTAGRVAIPLGLLTVTRATH